MQHSGFLQFDIDFQDNSHISNFKDLKIQISHIVCVAYCGISVRGKGFWGLVPIPKCSIDEHKLRYDALEQFFKGYKINLDPACRNISQLRIYSWDSEAYFNHNAKLFTNILRPKKRASSRPAYSDTRERVESIIEQIKVNKIDITQAYKDEWFKIASALANEFGEFGRNYFHAVSQFHDKYDVSETDRMFDDILKHDYTKISIGSFFKIAFDYGIKIPCGDTKKEEVNSITAGNQVTTLKKVRIIPEVIKSEQTEISNEIIELEQFFSSIKIPESIKLNQCTKISDTALFIKTHLDIVKAQDGKKTYIPYMERLQELEAILKNNRN
jgi:hypothetical protein